MPRSTRETILELLAWAWTFISGGGAIWYLYTRGPWPLTNGWFALCSGIAACPLIPWLFQRYAHIRVSGWLRFALAAAFIVAGKIALAAHI